MKASSINSFPTFYKGRMFKSEFLDDYMYLKVFSNGDWVWRRLRLRKQDIKYIQEYCSKDIRKNPCLGFDGKHFFLVFPFERERVLMDNNVFDRVICSVDLGINTHAVLSIMRSDGTILARNFIHFAKEEDHLNTLLGRMRARQSKYYARSLRAWWSRVNALNSGLSNKIAHAIVEFACLYNCDCIVMEYLDMHGKVHGSKAQRLALWRKRQIQRVVENQAHLYNMRFSRVCAHNTSRLAFDGTGRVVRGESAGFKNDKLCRFKSGKVYNCDLNASYNIGARYFIREILKSLSVRVERALLTKVQELSSRTSCTLSSLINMNIVLPGLVSS